MRGNSATAKILISAVFVIAGCARGPTHETDSEGVRGEILAIENQWATAIERQDAATFERLAAEDFRFIEENGQVLNRAQYIAARSHNPDSVESAVQDEIEARHYGDAAIATGRRTAIPVPLSLDGCLRATCGPMASCLRSTNCSTAVI